MKNNGFDCGTVIPLNIVVESRQKWDNVFFRFEISLMNDLKIATMFSGNGIYFLQDEVKRLLFNLNTEHLTPSRYRVDIIAYITDSLGEDHFIDGVYPGFVFEITDRINEKNQKVWHQNYWGAIHLQDVEVKEND